MNKWIRNYYFSSFSFDKFASEMYFSTKIAGIHCFFQEFDEILCFKGHIVSFKGKDQWIKILSLVKVLSIRNSTFFTGTKTDPVNRRYKAGKLDTLKSVRSTWGNERDFDVTSLAAPQREFRWLLKQWIRVKETGHYCPATSRNVTQFLWEFVRHLAWFIYCITCCMTSSTAPK